MFRREPNGKGKKIREKKINGLKETKG